VIGPNGDQPELSDDDLKRAQYLGAVAYLTAYTRGMARQLGVDDTDREAINQMVVQLVEPLNIATEAAWRAMMSDKKGTYQTLQRLRIEVEGMMK